jgi:hypothetical protein
MIVEILSYQSRKMFFFVKKSWSNILNSKFLFCWKGHQIFTVAKAITADILQALRGKLQEAQRDGIPFRAIQKAPPRRRPDLAAHLST